MKILFLVPYPLKESPSQRFRFEQYFHILEQTDHQYEVQSFLNTRTWRAFYTPGGSFIKAWALILGFARRIGVLFVAPFFEFVFIHREATPLGPPLIEWVLAKVLRKKIIYDFDDAIWVTDRKQESWLRSILKWRSKVGNTCSWSYKVSCGNEYLCSYARQFNNNVVYNPTTIDTEQLHNPLLYTKGIPLPLNEEKIVIGWTGSHSTLKYLDDIESVLQRIESKYPQVEVLVIADRLPTLKLPSLHFRQWSLETEISDLSTVDIGIMPLPDDEWAKGKCGFKALQYMALEIPTVASPIGVNTNIINHEIDGFLADTNEEWERAIIRLIEDKSIRDRVGLNARKKILNSYSVLSNSSTFMSLFEI